MARVVVRKLTQPEPSKAIREKTVVSENGRKIKIRSLDADSATFSGDLLAVFKRNVSAARRQNKAISDA